MAKRKTSKTGSPSTASASTSTRSASSKKRKTVTSPAVENAEEVMDVSTPSLEAAMEAEADEIMMGVAVADSATAAAADVVKEEESSPIEPRRISRKNVKKEEDLNCRFLGDPVSDDVARERWPHRYPDTDSRGKSLKTSGGDDDIVLAKRHYLKAEVDGHIFELNDDAHVASEENMPPYICKILELFEGVDGLPYFRAQWSYRSKDTVIKEAFTLREGKRIFPSDIQDDNPLDCLIEKIKIVRVKPNFDIVAKQSAIPECDYYYDMKYLVPYSTFIVPTDEAVPVPDDSHSSLSSGLDETKAGIDEVNQVDEVSRPEMRLLDLYSGCGAMSTGLCLGANMQGINLVTKWAVDINKYACESLKLNHPETEVRNETVDDFLTLLKEWKRLCASYKLIESGDTHEIVDAMRVEDGEDDAEDESEEEDGDNEEVYEVEQIVGICYGDPKDNNKAGLYLKVHWKGYGPDYDTWEPVDGLGNCWKSIGEFVRKGFQERVLPLPGDVDVICGGPPCQGLSGFNRFRNKESPLEDPKNKQLLSYMDVVDYLKPKYVLMENVVDLLKFSNGFCGRYALGKMVDMNYQARIGMMAAGYYGLPQFRMRVFLWGARPSEKLPQYPLPTHDVVYRGVTPVEFEMNAVAHVEGHANHLENKLFLGDAISDLPPVNNDETRDQILYRDEPKTDFQRFIRMTKDAMIGGGTEMITTLYDHRPLQLNIDDYQRVCRVPKRKGANFRDFPGVRVRQDKKVEWDPDVERVLLPSGKPLVPDYAMSFVGGTSSKPFGRLWYDETVPTVVTRAEPHNQKICHPAQDRVLTIRENARLQGFPDYYQLKGPVKERYIQVGNAVAVPVARALGYSLASASQGLIDNQPLMVLPAGFPVRLAPTVEDAV
ncbi:DNA (cytosine-5)-methyltransferase CMT3-like [Silene latifolia]|uniref:DNA (cytosine-5)-methyltransferase CMT3-like n=1 Tax=Silene latifolia TaxID=37657 RepID=UPI003D786A72